MNDLKAFFVSDLHLGSLEEPNYVLFNKFLDSLYFKKATHLFLVGDIFDMWLGKHQYFVEKHQELIDKLVDLKLKGIEIHYFEGNHDLYLKDYWEGELGFFVHEGPTYFNLGSKKIRVEHGDQIDKDDQGYLFLRWFLRTRGMTSVAKNLPGGWAAGIGNWASKKSRNYTSEVKTITQDEVVTKIRLHAMTVWQMESFDYIISGHLHYEDDYSFELEGSEVRSVNLGTWLKPNPKAFVVTEEGGNWEEIS